MAAIASRSQPSHGDIFAFDGRYVRDTDINENEDEEYGTMSRPRIPRERSYRAPAAAARGGGFTDYTSVKSAPTSAATSAAVSPARSPIPSYRRQRSVTFVSGRDGAAARANGGAERQDYANSTNRSAPFQREERPEYHTLTSDSAVKAAKEAMAELFEEKRRYVEQQSIMSEAKAPITTTDASILVSNPVFSHSSSSDAVEEYLSQKNLQKNPNSYSAAAAAFATQLPLQNQSSRPQDGGAFGVTPYKTFPDMGSRAGSMRSRSMTPRRRRAHEKRKVAEEDLSFYDDSFVEEFVLSTKNELEERERAAREERERAEALLIKAAEVAKRARALEEQQLRIEEEEEERRQAHQKNNREGRRPSQSYRRADDDVDGAATNGNASKKTNNGGVASLIHEHTRRMQYTPRRRVGCDDEDDEENDNFSPSSSVDNSNDNANDADDVESEYRAYSASHHRAHQNRANLDSHNSLPMVTRRAAAATGSSSLKRNRDDCSECPTCGSHSAPRHSDRRRVEEEYDPQQTDRKKNANKTPVAPTANVRGRGPRAASSAAAAVVGVTFASPLQDVRVPNSQLTSSDDSDDNDDDHRERLLEKGRGVKGGKGANTTDRSSSKGGRRIESAAEAVEGARCRSVTSTLNARGTANNHNNSNSKNNPNPYEEGDTLLERLHSVDRPVLLGRVRRGAKATNNTTVATNNSFTGGGANQMFSEEAQRATARRRRTGTATAATASESTAQASAVGRARTRGENKSDNDTSSNSVFGDKETDDLVFGAPVVSGAGGRRAKFAATTQKAGRGGKVSSASSAPAPPLFSSAAFDPTDPMSVFFESAFPTPSKYDAVVNGSTSNMISAAPVGRRKNANGSFPLMLPTTIAKKR